MHYDKWIAPTDPNPSEMEKAHAELAYEAGLEGMVLLANDGTLPLQNKRIALYGAGARHATKGGTGSGEVHNRYNISVEDGLVKAGFSILSLAWLDGLDKRYQQAEQDYVLALRKALKPYGLFNWNGMLPASDAVPPVFPTSLPIEGKLDTDTAIYVLTRQAGEGKERRAEKGDYYLTDLEEANIAYLAKTYPHFVLVINAGGPVDLSILDRVKVPAVVFMGQPGQEGGRILADLLSGWANFSGHLSLSWPKRLEDLPSGRTFSYLKGTTDYENYVEGIYVGYRFHETFGVEPRYRFGYGLSFTKFGLESALRKDGKQWALDYKVTNIGSRSGRAVIQVYVSPFTEALSEALKLVSFAKTEEIEPGRCASGSIPFDIRELAYYDEGEAAYLIAKGNYLVKAGFDAGDLQPIASIEVKDPILVEQCVNVCPIKEKFQEIVPPQREYAPIEGVPEFELKSKDIAPVIHDYQTTECPPVKVADEDLVDLVIGSLNPMSSEKPLAIPGFGGRTSAKYFTMLGLNCLATADGPAGLRLNPEFSANDGKRAKGSTIPENLRLGKPFFNFVDKLLSASTMKKHYQYATAFPTGLLQASTWNVNLIEKIGHAVAEEMAVFDIDIWLSPGMNIVRNPLCGRTYEYYSEDPYLTGQLAGHLSKGVNSVPGRGLTLKHYCCNSQEDDRFHCDSRLHERALRDLYLKAFKIAIAIGNPTCVMSSYNRVNGVYAGSNPDLCERVLRSEFGFNGFMMSDWDAQAPDRASCEGQLKGGTDLLMPGSRWMREETAKALKEGRLSRADLEKAVNRIINVANRLKEGQ